MTEKNFSLYDLTNKEVELKELALSATSEEDYKALEDTYESLSLAIDDKLDGCCKVVSELNANINMFKEEEARLVARRKTIENNLKQLKEYMMLNMKKLSIDSISVGTHKISIAKNGGSRKMEILVDDPNKLPEDFKVVEVKPDKKAIYNMFKQYNKTKDNDVLIVNGQKIAKLEPRGEHLSIR